MCNRYGYKNPLTALQREFSELGHVRWDGLAPNATDLLQIRPTDRAPIRAFAFPGLWNRSETADGSIDSFTLLTSAPGPDQVPYHNRQPVILERGQWAEWVDPANDMAPSFKGSPAGTIRAERFIERAPTDQPTLL